MSRRGAAVLDGVAEDLRHLRERVDVHFQRGGHLLKGVLRYRRRAAPARREPGGRADGGDEEEKSGELMLWRRPCRPAGLYIYIAYYSTPQSECKSQDRSTLI